VEKLWIDLGSQDAATSHRVIDQLVARPARAVAFLEKHLRPISTPDPCHVAGWLADLDSDDFATRERATQALEKACEVVESALLKELSRSSSLEARWRIKDLLARVRAERLFPSVERIRVVRAVEVLERIGNEPARRILSALARGAWEAQLSLEARAALKRLETLR
jgi:hypothetical protein